MSEEIKDMEKRNGTPSTSDENNTCSYPRKQTRKSNYIKVKGTLTYKRDDVIKWNGWGYIDSYFYMDDKIFKFSGNRYSISNTEMPYFYGYIKERLDCTINSHEPIMGPIPADYTFQKSCITDIQLESLKKLPLKVSIEDSDRLNRSHGQTPNEIYYLIRNSIERIPDCVIWPTCHEDVVEIIKICDEQNIVIIPFGGGTNVTNSVQCPVDEKRTILSLDTSMMNEILWIDEESLTACCESGILGQDLERELHKIGYTMGHEPDSVEFSSLGGWVATRASGMKKNAYGNIEDIVVQVRMATPRGVLERNNRVPRLSCGPDLNHVIMGSEGNFGVITEVVVKIRPMPKCSRYGSLMFPDFESGVACLREIARQRCQPASLRLVDNQQFELGKALTKSFPFFEHIKVQLSLYYLTKVIGFDLKKVSFAAIKYEDDEDHVNVHEKRINAIAAKYGGIPAGSAHGETTYTMTFVIAYLRDVGITTNVSGETFETSVPWDKLLSMVSNTKSRVGEECKKVGIDKHLVMCRLAQVYDAGACIYFYFFFDGGRFEDSCKVCESVIEGARDTIIEYGGSISHHHGVGKIRQKWFNNTVGSVGLDLLKACKKQMDPNNIFAVSNLSSDLTSLP